MAKIAPFRGYRFNKLEVGDLNQVVTQPYDKIDDQLRDEYMQRNDFNIVRIIKGPPKPDDTPNDNPYTRAATYWEEWIENRVLVREPGPAVYPYFQEFTIDGKTYVRKGLIVLVDLEDTKLKVRAHEHTLSGPKADRLKLMKATEANDGQIFMLYNDPENTINNWIDQGLIGAQPLMVVNDDYGARHKLYRITNPSVIRDMAEVFENLELFIADGHHRFETAVNYMNECKDRKRKPDGLETFTHRMMTLVNMHDPGLAVLPTHRVLHSLAGYSPDTFLSQASEYFDIAEFYDRAGLFAALDNAVQDEKIAIGFATEGLNGLRLLTLKNPTIMDNLVTEEHCEAWRRLDVTVLHTILLDKILGINQEKLAAESNVRYVRGRDEALDHVGKSGNQVAFLVNPTRVDQVREVAAAGERMPQKSTDFFPKLLTGMVMMKMKIDKSNELAVWKAEDL